MQARDVKSQKNKNFYKKNIKKKKWNKGSLDKY